MPKPEVIEDYYGCKLSVQVVGASIGYVVDLECGGDAENLEDFYRLTPDQARKLAKQLEKAAEEAEQ